MKSYHKNPRQITTKQYSDLEKWLRELGDLSGIVHDLNSDEIIGGNQRGRVFNINACQVELTEHPHDPDEQGTVAQGFVIWEGKRYAYRQVRWNEKQCEQANIVANKAGGEWDFDTLANEFEIPDLLEWGFTEKELQLGGFDLDKETKDAEPQIDKAEELREKWGVELGQLWQLGEHRLICGDCTDRAVVERVMGGEKAVLFFTDPPYGMDKGFENDELKDNDLTAFNDKWIPLFDGNPDAIFISFHSPRLFWTVLDSARNNGWKVGRYFSLYKPNDMTFPWHSWLGVSESILLFLRGKPKFNTEPPLDTSFWHDTYLWNHKGLVAGENKTDRQSYSHPSIKPIPVCVDLIHKTSFSGDLVYEPFSGSGTTMIACENLGRKCRAVEISPAYCAVSIQRWVDLTGGTPILLQESTSG